MTGSHFSDWFSYLAAGNVLLMLALVVLGLAAALIFLWKIRSAVDTYHSNVEAILKHQEGLFQKQHDAFREERAQADKTATDLKQEMTAMHTDIIMELRTIKDTLSAVSDTAGARPITKTIENSLESYKNVAASSQDLLAALKHFDEAMRQVTAFGPSLDKSLQTLKESIDEARSGIKEFRESRHKTEQARQEHRTELDRMRTELVEKLNEISAKLS
jgi:methyl-accepting chemotaxis protein